MDKRIIINSSGATELTEYDPSTDTLNTKVVYDVEPQLDSNKAERNACPEFGKYKGGSFHKVMSIDMNDIQRLKGLGYNLMSHDQDEVKRALLYVQSEEKYQMTVTGTPIARKKTLWQ